MEHLKMQTPDIVSENMAYIAQRWPECLTEAKDENGRLRQVVDFDKLRQVLSSDATGEGRERYQFTWPDKRHAIRLANAPTTDTLRPCREDSTDFDNTQNLYIEGDNLDVLKLLRESYLGKVKMIYIDPPYNTGGDFVYKDNFIKKNSDYAEVSGAYDEEGNQVVNEFEKNSDSNGRFHTDWLNMIYPRLKVARDLLTEDGVIFISIDENELTNLHKICDEIFGSNNFEATIIPISNPGGRDYKQVAITNEYLLIYSKSEDSILNEMPQAADFKLTDSFGGYDPRELRNRNPKFHSGNRPNLFYPFFVNPNIKDAYGYCAVSLQRSEEYYIEVRPYNSQGAESVWRWGKPRASQNIIADSTDRSQVVARQKNDGNWNIYEKCRRSTTKAKSLWDETEMRTENGTREVRALFGATVFDHPKPLGLLYRSVMMGSDTDSLILDFFSGSATTAHAVMQLNAEDGGHRRYICVQLPEETPEDSEARKAGYATIPEIAKERIRRAAKKIKEDHPDWEGDTGFRVLKLDSSNMENVFYTPAETTEHTLFDDNIKPNRTDEDLLFQVMMELGVALSDKIEKTKLAGKTVWNVGEGYLVACFESNLTEDIITAIAKQQPQYFVLADRSLASDNVADNFEQIFNEYSESTIRRII